MDKLYKEAPKMNPLETPSAVWHEDPMTRAVIIVRTAAHMEITEPPAVGLQSRYIAPEIDPAMDRMEEAEMKPYFGAHSEGTPMTSFSPGLTATEIANLHTPSYDKHAAQVVEWLGIPKELHPTMRLAWRRGDPDRDVNCDSGFTEDDEGVRLFLCQFWTDGTPEGGEWRPVEVLP